VDWTKVDDRRAILLYENKTGKLDWTPGDVAKWLQDNGATMPIPPTPLEMLTQRIARAAGAALERDPGATVEHRVHLACPTTVNGEKQMRWVDMDSPALTPEKFMEAEHARREQALNILVRRAADFEHVRRMRPNWDLSQPDANLEWEVRLRLNLPPDEGEATKTG